MPSPLALLNSALQLATPSRYRTADPLDLAIRLSKAVIDAPALYDLNQAINLAGTERYVRVKGGGAGGMDRVRLRNGQAAPPGANVQIGPKGGHFFDEWPQLRAKRLATPDSNAVARPVPASWNVKPNPFGPAQQPAPAPAQQRLVGWAGANPASAPKPAPAPQSTPRSVRTDPRERAKEINDLRAPRGRAQVEMIEAQRNAGNVQRRLKVILDRLVIGDMDPGDAQQLPKLAADMVQMGAAVKEKKDLLQDAQNQVQGKKVEHRDRDAAHDQKDNEQVQRHAAARFAANPAAGNYKPVPHIGAAEVAKVMTFGQAGLHENAGIHGNVTFVAEMKPGVFKPSPGQADTRACFKVDEQRGGPGSELNAEIASFAVSEVLGWDICPTVMRADLPKGMGHVMRWVDDSGFGGKAKRADSYLSGGGKIEGPEMLDSYVKMWVYDMIIGNTDRHSQNWCVDPEQKRVWAIDNGYAFDKWNRGGSHYPANHLSNQIQKAGWAGVNVQITPQLRTTAKKYIDQAISQQTVLEAAVMKECPKGLATFRERMEALKKQVV